MKGEFISYENIGQAECGEYIALGVSGCARKCAPTPPYGGVG